MYETFYPHPLISYRLYSVNAVLYCHLQHHNDTIIKTQEDFFNKIFTSHFIARARKGLLKVCVWEGAGDRTELKYFDPPLLWPSTLCRSRSPDAQPEALGSTLLSAGFLYCILSAPSLVPKLHRGSWGPPRPGVAFPTTSINPSNCNCNCHLTSVLTELYNSSTPTRSATRSLEWHDWSSSSGNNCYAVHWSLSSGASVYEYIMGFTLPHFISQIHPRDLFRILAIGMCHFLPVHHFVMACLLGPKVKIKQLFYYKDGFWIK